MRDHRESVVRLEAAFAKQAEEICHRIFLHPEKGMEEVFSSSLLAEVAEREGFTVQKPCCGMDTAFTALWGTKGPCVAFLAEYDALPGFGGDGNSYAHACGHNWIAAVETAAAVTLKNVCRELGLQARILLAGCPAEETYGSKVLFCRNGIFDGVDCALQAHLGDATNIYHRFLALSALEIRFFGKASHASAAPWDGINALDAVQLFYNGISVLRQQLHPDVRIHGIVKEGGAAANSIPERASCLYYVRASRRDELDEVVEKVKNVARGAALMTGARLELSEPELPMDDMVRLPALQALAADCLAKEELFSVSAEEEARRAVGSTDVGNVSHVCPTLYMEVADPDLPPFYGHTESALSLADERAYPLLHRVTRALTEMGLRVIEDPDLRQQLWQQHAASI